MPAPSEKGGRTILQGLLLLAAGAVGTLLGGFCVYFYFHDYLITPSSTAEETSQTSVPTGQSAAVSALGRIEPRDGILSLGVPVPDRIRRILVKEGDAVKKGDPLAILDSEQLRKLELDSAVIQRKQSETRLQAITANGEAQIRAEQLRRERTEQMEPLEMKALTSKIAFLTEQERIAQKNTERYVAAGDTIAAQDREKQELALRQAKTELIATQNELEKLRTSSKLNRRAVGAQLEAMRAELKQSQSAVSLDLLDTQVKQADERLRETKILAPSDGKILRILVHEGELIQRQSILQMANVDKMIVVAEVRVGDKPDISVKDRATITSHVFKKELGGEVYSIMDIVGKPQVTSPDPLASVDYRIVEVKILLDQGEPAAHYIGHEVNVTIRPRK